MIEVLSPRQVDAARPAGAFVGSTLAELQRRAEPGTNLLEINDWTVELIARRGAVSCYVDYAPSFGTGPFGKVICTSVNDAVLHGLPHDYELLPGDLVFTGTPAGVGFARKPPRWLKPGDEVVVRVEGLGELVNPVVAEG